MKARDFSVHPVHVVGEPARRYAKVKPEDGVIAPGRRVSVQWTGETTWTLARMVAPPDNATGGGGIVWVEIVEK